MACDLTEGFNGCANLQDLAVSHDRLRTPVYALSYPARSSLILTILTTKRVRQ
jgi:hypothetical protein